MTGAPKKRLKVRPHPHGPSTSRPLAKRQNQNRWAPFTETADSHMVRRTLSKKEAALIARKYAQGGRSMAQLGAEFGFTAATILKALRRQGVASRDRVTAGRSYQIREDFFERVDSEEKAYWLGFLAADGSISPKKGSRSPSIRVELQARDRPHLEKLRKALAATHPVRDTSRENIAASALGWRSSLMAGHLAEYGLTPKKAARLILKLDKIRPELHRHFWRGAVDGDGWITLSHPQVGLVGSEHVCASFVAFLRSNAIRHTGRIYRVGNIARADVNGTAAAQTCHLLYHDATVSLDRKMTRAQQLPRIIQERRAETLARKLKRSLEGEIHRKRTRRRLKASRKPRSERRLFGLFKQFEARHEISGPPFEQSALAALSSKSRGHGDCLVWEGPATRAGVGIVTVNDLHLVAHRLAYELATGRTLGKTRLSHSCKNSLCINPDHLQANEGPHLDQKVLESFHSSYLVKGNCWHWTKTRLPSGYPQFRKGYAHRYSFQRFIGPIPHSKQVSHSCGHRDCVNPAHLQLTSAREASFYVSRDRCSQGHLYTAKNTAPVGIYRRCRECDRMRALAYRARRKSRAPRDAKEG